jgi:hypothetical protein
MEPCARPRGAPLRSPPGRRSALARRAPSEIERIEREGEIERFSSALAADAILPEDFAR